MRQNRINRRLCHFAFAFHKSPDYVVVILLQTLQKIGLFFYSYFHIMCIDMP